MKRLLLIALAISCTLSAAAYAQFNNVSVAGTQINGPATTKNNDQTPAQDSTTPPSGQTDQSPGNPNNNNNSNNNDQDDQNDSSQNSDAD